MKQSLELAEKLIRQSYLEKNEYIELLSAYKDEKIVICLRKEADRLRQKYYGNKVYMRGLIEFTNFCKNNCYYCGIRRDNKNASRYRLTKEEILDCCKMVMNWAFAPLCSREAKILILRMIRSWRSLRRSEALIQTVPLLFPLERKQRKATAFTKKQEQTGICCAMKRQMKITTVISIQNR